MMTKSKKLCLLAVFMFWLGYEAKDNRIFPLTHFYKRHFVDQPEPVKTVAQQHYNVFTQINTKTRIPCPKPEQTEVIVGIGQSNAANTGGHRFQNEDRKIVNFFNGSCYLATDPMLGATDNRGSLWIPFANAYKRDKTILLVTFAVGATSISQWVNKDDLGKHFDQNMANLSDAGYQPDTFIWVQGESDISSNLELFSSQLKQFIGGLSAQFPASKIAISGTSYCGGHSRKPLLKVQRKVAKQFDLIWLGSTDSYYESQYRYDDCHLSQQGLNAVAQQFAKVLRP